MHQRGGHERALDRMEGVAITLRIGRLIINEFNSTYHNLFILLCSSS